MVTAGESGYLLGPVICRGSMKSSCMFPTIRRPFAPCKPKCNVTPSTEVRLEQVVRVCGEQQLHTAGHCEGVGHEIMNTCV